MIEEREGRRSIRNKRGNFTVDIIVLIVILFVGAVMFVVLKQFQDVGQEIIGDIEGVDPQIQENYQKTNSYNFWDGFYFFIFLALLLSLWVSVWFIDSHPVFFVILLILVGAFLLISMALNNAYLDLFTNTGTYSETASGFAIMPFIMGHIVAITVIVAFVTGILLFAKMRVGQ